MFYGIESQVVSWREGSGGCRTAQESVDSEVMVGRWKDAKFECCGMGVWKWIAVGCGFD